MRMHAAQANDKPLFGEPYTGCGACCLLGQCPANIALRGEIAGPCRDLELIDGRYRCGLSTSPDFTPTEQEAIRVSIGQGFGCDMVDPRNPADVRSRAANIARMVKQARLDNRNATPLARAHLARWRLAPP